MSDSGRGLGVFEEIEVAASKALSTPVTVNVTVGRDSSSSIYIIGWSDDGPVKVGIARDLKSRLSAIQTGCPFRLRVLHAVPAGRFAQMVEAETHRTLAEHRLEGEWFSCSAEHAEGVASAWVAAILGRLTPNLLARTGRTYAYFAIPALIARRKPASAERREPGQTGGGKAEAILAAYQSEAKPVREIAQQFGVVPRTVYRLLKVNGVQPDRMSR